MDVLFDEIKVPLHTLPRWNSCFLLVLSPCFVGISMQVARGMELSEIILCMFIFICYSEYYNEIRPTLVLSQIVRRRHNNAYLKTSAMQVNAQNKSLI